MKYPIDEDSKMEIAMKEMRADMEILRPIYIPCKFETWTGA